MKIRDTFLAFGTPDFTDEEISAVSRVMNSGWVGMGQETIAFEKELSSYIGVPEVVSVNSCTSALFLALLTHDIGPGDEVIVPSLTWCATANAALYLGATPVFGDVDKYSMCVTADTVMEQVTSRTKAVIVVHYGGYAIDINALRSVLPEHIIIIEDAAHAMGARYPSGGYVGSSGNIVCFSFYANKNLSTAEGGAIALSDNKMADRLRSLRMSGMGNDAWSRYTRPAVPLAVDISEIGYKMNFTDLQAAIGRVQLKRFNDMAKVRRNLVDYYISQFNNLLPNLQFQSGILNDNHACHLLVGIFDPEVTGIKRNELLSALRSRNIGASVHYQPLHTMALYYPYLKGKLPITQLLSEQIMTLPISAKMSMPDVDYVMDHFSDLIAKRI